MLVQSDIDKRAKILRESDGQIEIGNQEEIRKPLWKQNEAQNVSEKHWPWSKPIKPRGIGNLRLEEIFPDDEMRQPKQMVGLLKLGTPGGGAPNTNEYGRKLIRTREDPILRFQWGKDLRQAVDNSIRYRKDKGQQEKYKQQLDRMLDQKKKLQKQEKRKELEQEHASLIKTPPWGKPGPGGGIWRPPRDIGLNFLNSMGWSDTHALNKLENVYRVRKKNNSNEQGPHKNTCYTTNEHNKENDNIKPYRLSPLMKSKGMDGDLVNVIARKRYQPITSLATTDVTKDKKDEYYFTKWKNDRQVYLRELMNQMHCKEKKKEELKLEEMKSVQRHFATWDDFWGRPGHGAPLPVTRKGHIERMLFPQVLPVGIA